MNKILLALTLTTAIFTIPSAFAMNADECWVGMDPNHIMSVKNREALPQMKGASDMGYSCDSYRGSKVHFNKETLFQLEGSPLDNIDALTAQNNRWRYEINALELFSRELLSGKSVSPQSVHHLLRIRTEAFFEWRFKQDEPIDLNDKKFPAAYHAHAQLTQSWRENISQCKFIASPEALQDWIAERQQEIENNNTLIAGYTEQLGQ